MCTTFGRPPSWLIIYSFELFLQCPIHLRREQVVPPSSVVCCFSAFYINILFNLHQTCAGPTLFEVGMLLYSAYIYPFMLTTLHLFDPFRFNSIVKPLGMKKGGGGSVAICSCFGFFYTGSLCDGFLRRVCDHKQEMLTLPWHLISPWACFYPWVRASHCLRSYT